jgi:hypothetical protein
MHDELLSHQRIWNEQGRSAHCEGVPQPPSLHTS